ncbi:copper resistance protein C [Microtetraspora sp. NBRC 13810]|uniref:copper resistance CopC family protein n=1 Tax=Microtetraspora sp. NBRC 13810 TaxID=3030990 RepID=UPI0024A15DFF|nr:copper resistance CopC family protein [Microtetraspora sp. NBRC 13810]GLW10620.1 copper resistance protein C [Microtetraspora sp. NBRC 13810]
MKTSPIGAVLALLAALSLLPLLATPALAHDSLKRSDPAKNAQVPSVDKVTLEFSAHVTFPAVVVTGAGGDRHESGRPEVDGPVVTQELDGPLPPGKYTVAYRIVSSDGHPVEGEIPFTVVGSSAGPAPAAAITPSAGNPPPAAGNAPAVTPVSGEEQDGGLPGWLWIVVGALIGIGIGMFFSLRNKKR